MAAAELNDRVGRLEKDEFMVSKRSIWFVLLTIGITCLPWAAGCAQPEKKEPKRHTVRVRAPYTSVDVSVPAEDDDDEPTRVDVDVDD